MKRVIVCGAAILGLALGGHAGDVPFIETFDERSIGPLKDQNGWGAVRAEDATVQAATTAAGSQAGAVSSNAVVWNDFSDSAATNVWVDFYARVSYSPDNAPPALTGSVAAAFFPGTDGQIRALSNATWVTLNSDLDEGEWYRFSVNLDYASERWQLHLAGREPNVLAVPLATNLAFAAGSTNAYLRRFRIKN